MPKGKTARQPARKLQPHLTQAGRNRLLAREREVCGPLQLALRFKSVGTAYHNGDWKMLSGALDDLAAVAVAWSERVKAEKARSYTP